MAAGAVKHDYHLVNPSPWPLVGSIAVFILAIGGIGYMHTGTGPEGEPTGGLGLGFFTIQGPWVMLAGFAMVLYTMAGWWRDVIKESHAGDHTPVVQIGLRYGMVLFIASEVMFFVAWFWAFFGAFLFPGGVETAAGDIIGQYQRQEVTGGHWPPDGVYTLDPWHLPLMNTLILLTSGTTVTWAHHALQEGNRKGLLQGLWLTVILGLFFTAVQGYEYYHILSDDLFTITESDNALGIAADANIYKSTFFMATGFHGVHVIIGTIFLIVCLARAHAGHFTPQKHFGFEAAAWYWHFVDVVWLFLFVCIYILAAGTPGAH